jgi:hypothetical protein
MIISSSSPEEAYQALPPRDKDLLKTEFAKATTITTNSTGSSVTDTHPNIGATPNSSSCWSKSAETTLVGGVTQTYMFTVGQTTTVCASGGQVTSVGVSNPYTNTHGYPGIHAIGVQTSTLNVGWEGRGVANGTFGYGVGGWDLYTGSQCTKLYLNADMVHYRGSTECSL